MKDEDYGKGLDNFVITCVDCIVINSKDEMLLGKRTIYPHRDWYIVGGKMVPGESFGDTVVRNIRRELGLNIDRSRFIPLPAIYSLVWSKRQQKPRNHGSHTTSITMVLRISDEEIGDIKPNYEYKKMQWIRPEDVKDDPSFHDAIRTYAADMIVFLLNHNFTGN